MSPSANQATHLVLVKTNNVLSAHWGKWEGVGRGLAPLCLEGLHLAHPREIEKTQKIY